MLLDFACLSMKFMLHDTFISTYAARYSRVVMYLMAVCINDVSDGITHVILRVTGISSLF